MGVKDKVVNVAMKINSEFGKYVDRGFDQFQESADRGMNFTNRGVEHVENYADQSLEHEQNVTNRGQTTIQYVRQTSQYRNRIALLL